MFETRDDLLSSSGQVCGGSFERCRFLGLFEPLFFEQLQRLCRGGRRTTKYPIIICPRVSIGVKLLALGDRIVSLEADADIAIYCFIQIAALQIMQLGLQSAQVPVKVSLALQQRSQLFVELKI